MKVSTPKLLNDIVEWMRAEMHVELYNESDDGRNNSIINEEQIVESLILDSPFKIGKAEKRKHEDFVILDDTTITVNIKVVDRYNTRMQNMVNGIKGFSHLLFGQNISKWSIIHNLIENKEFNEKHIWLICINNKNPNDIMLREFGQFHIDHYNINPSNPVQLNLTDEWELEPTIRNNRSELIVSLIQQYGTKLYNAREDLFKIARKEL